MNKRQIARYGLFHRDERAIVANKLLDVDANARRMVDIDPAAVLAGDAPRLIDEWQLQPAIWNQVRRAVDERAARGQFILTGSAIPADDITRHTGAGRFTRLRLRPMSLREIGRSNGRQMKPDTAAAYLDALERLMVLENQPAWSPHLRSRAMLRSTPVRHFVDPSLAVAALRTSPQALLADLNYFGFLFESMFSRLAKRLAETDHGRPAALAVILPSGYGYTGGNTDVGVIPIAALGP